MRVSDYGRLGYVEYVLGPLLSRILLVLNFLVMENKKKKQIVSEFVRGIELRVMNL